MPHALSMEPPVPDMPPSSTDSKTVSPALAASVYGVRTSHSHPLSVSWLFLHRDESDSDLLFSSAPNTTTSTSTTASNLKPGGNIGLTSCPGKRVRLDAPLAPQMRPPVARDLDIDLPRLASMGVRLIVNCLSDDELAFLGAPWPRYSSIAASLGLTVARIPMVDGSVPPNMSILHDVIEAMHASLQHGHNVIVHCRGGIGRAALVSCCYMLKHGIIDDAARSIEFVRQRRSRRAVETVEQERFIEGFYEQYCRKKPRQVEETQFVIEHEEQGAGAQDVDPEDVLVVQDGDLAARFEPFGGEGQ